MEGLCLWSPLRAGVVRRCRQLLEGKGPACSKARSTRLGEQSRSEKWSPDGTYDKQNKQKLWWVQGGRRRRWQRRPFSSWWPYEWWERWCTCVDAPLHCAMVGRRGVRSHVNTFLLPSTSSTATKQSSGRCAFAWPLSAYSTMPSVPEHCI